MSQFQKFTCSDCGGTVDLNSGTGRTREYSRGFKVPIPDDFVLPTCSRCGEIYVLPEMEAKLTAVLRKRFLEMQSSHYRELVDILALRNGVKQMDIVRACGVTPSYMSHILNGKRKASTTLTRLLEAFAVCNTEFMRHVEGRHWSSFNVTPYQIRSRRHGHTPAPMWNASQNDVTPMRWAESSAEATQAEPLQVCGL